MSSAFRSGLFLLLACCAASADLEFFGNRYFSDADLLEFLGGVVPPGALDELRRSDVDDAAYAIERLYLREGFCFAEVDYFFSGGPDASFATLVVQEGPQAYIARVDIEGVENAPIPLERIEATFYSKRGGLLGLGEPLFRQAALADAAAAIEESYQREGYRDVVVEPPWVSFDLDGEPDESGMLPVYIGVAVREGIVYTVTEVTFEDGAPWLEPAERATLRETYERKPSRLAHVQELRHQVLGILADRGHLRADVDVLEARDESGAVVLHVSAEPGPVYTLGEVRFEGLVYADEDFVRPRLAVTPGQVYSRSDVAASSRALFNTGLFRTVTVEPTAFGVSDTVDLVFTLKEAARREVRLTLAGGSLDIVRGGVEYFDRTLFGTGLPFTAGVRASFIEAGVESSISYPHFLESDWTARILASHIQTRDTRNEGILERNETLVELRFSHVFLRHFELGLGARFRRVNNFAEIDTQAIFGTDLPDNYNTVSVFAALGLDTRDDFFFPSAGWIFNLSVEVGGKYLGSQVDFFRSELSLRTYLGFGERTSLALRGDIALAIPIDTEPSLPIPERLFSGGHDTVRSFKDGELGFREADGDPVGGEVRNTLGLELRYRMLGNLYVAGFAEYGNVALTTSEAFEDFRPSLGAGLRYALPIGPLRLDVGFNPDVEGREDLYRLHFNIGQAF